jgi:hypothetical protein
MHALVVYKMLTMGNEDTSLVHTRAAKGGEARAASLSPERKKAIGKLAADARWGGSMPQASHDGPLQIGDAILMAAVLPSGRRLLSQGTFLQAIGRARTTKAGTGSLSGDGLPPFLQAEQLKPFISEELRLATSPILFRFRSGSRAAGHVIIGLGWVNPRPTATPLTGYL